MNGSAEHGGASAKPSRREVVLNLRTAKKMLPLLERIVGEAVETQRRLEVLSPELDRLDRTKRTLAWPDRERRYHIRDEIAKLSANLQEALDELDRLGVTILDMDEGRIGLPTSVNGHLAFFSWRCGEDNLAHWHFAGENIRRAIPASWKDANELRVASKS